MIGRAFSSGSKTASVVIVSVIAALAVAATSCIFWFSDSWNGRTASVVELVGTVEAIRDGETVSLSEGDAIKSDDRIVVAERSAVRIKLDEEKYLFVSSNSDVTVELGRSRRKNVTVLRINEGELCGELRKPLDEKSSVDVYFPKGVAHIGDGQLFRVYAEDAAGKGESVKTAVESYVGGLTTDLYNRKGKSTGELRELKEGSCVGVLADMVEDEQKTKDKLPCAEYTEEQPVDIVFGDLTSDTTVRMIAALDELRGSCDLSSLISECGKHYKLDGKYHGLGECGKHYDCDGINHDAAECGEHFYCEEGNHTPAACGEHYSCQGEDHNTLDPCGDYLCGTKEKHEDHDIRACGLHFYCDKGDHTLRFCDKCMVWYYACDRENACICGKHHICEQYNEDHDITKCPRCREWYRACDPAMQDFHLGGKCPLYK